MKTKLTYLLMIVCVSFYSCKEDEEPKTPPVVTTSAAANITTTSAIVGGNITGDGNAAVTSSGVAYSANVAVPTIADNKVESTTTTGEFTSELTNLSSGTVYHVRAFATNAVGTAYGDVVEFTTGNAAPAVNNLTIAGTVEVSKTLTATYTYADAESDAEGATAFQWYSATSADGGGETAIAGATSKTFAVTESENGKFLRVSVTPKAATGTTDGAEVKSAYTAAVGAETVTFTYNGVSVTYGTIISAKTQKKWLDRNLGATRAAQAINDYQAYGDMFQWGRLADGHQLVTRTGPNDADVTGVTGITSTTAPYETSSTDVPTTNKFIINANSGSTGDWRTTQNDNLWQGVSGVNNPCPAGWRIPTQAEWTAEAFTSGTDAFAKLKLTYTGQRSQVTGAVSNSTSGIYWTSTIRPSAITPGFTRQLSIDAATVNIANNNYTNRGAGEACRCIKD